MLTLSLKKKRVLSLTETILLSVLFHAAFLVSIPSLNLKDTILPMELDIDILKVSEAYCGKGMVMKRWRARAKGRPGKINKFLSNITIKVAETQNDKEESK